MQIFLTFVTSLIIIFIPGTKSQVLKNSRNTNDLVTAHASNSCLMLDYVRNINFFIIIIIILDH